MKQGKGWLVSGLFVFVIWTIVESSFAQARSSKADKVAFSSMSIEVGSTSLTVEVADTDERRRHGLMYRQSLDDDRGMLFVFPKSEVLSFWMKNTFIALSIAFINEDFRIIDIQDMQPVSSILERPSSYQSKASALMALEVNQGWFKRNRVSLGDLVQFPQVIPSPLLISHVERMTRPKSED